ncbi:hypothetical protein [Veillonella magna]|uniref:hypothetical protein n=1 Tax=Veillonella magna TaxID=464322 RepID=UPI0023F461A3|nr:hypothetical protein [Veillonella magna]
MLSPSPLSTDALRDFCRYSIAFAYAILRAIRRKRNKQRTCGGNSYRFSCEL